MRLRLTSRDTRALLFGTAGLSLIIGGFRGLPEWASWRSDVLLAATEMALQANSALTAVEGLEAALDSAEAMVALFREVGSSLLVAPSSAEANAMLVQLVSEAARLSSIRTAAVECRTDTTASRYLRPLVATIQGEGDIAGLANLLRILESHEVLLSVRELAVQPVDVHTRDETVETLRIRLTIDALALIREPEEP